MVTSSKTRLKRIACARVIGLAMKVHRMLGSGFLEPVYANALAIELQRVGIGFERECRISVTYEGIVVGEFQADFVVAEPSDR